MKLKGIQCIVPSVEFEVSTKDLFQILQVEFLRRVNLSPEVKLNPMGYWEYHGYDTCEGAFKQRVRDATPAELAVVNAITELRVFFKDIE